MVPNRHESNVVAVLQRARTMRRPARLAARKPPPPAPRVWRSERAERCSAPRRERRVL